MQKQVLLIQPPVEDFYTTDCRTQPLGLAYLSAAIKNQFPEIDIIIYDAFIPSKKKTIPWPKEFSYLKKYYGYQDASPFKLFHQYYRFGKSMQEIQKDLTLYSPFLIGISSLFTPYYRQSLEMAAICRSLFPKAKIAMGGSHATVAPESLLNARNNTVDLCDYVIPGEGEALITRLVDFLLNENTGEPPAGILTRKNPSNTANFPLEVPELDLLAYPDFSSLKVTDYKFNKEPMSFLVTSRSCPYYCSFCAIHAVSGNKYRRRKNENIIIEIEMRIKQGSRHIDIEDDHFCANSRRTMELLDQIIERKLDVTFSAMNGIVYWSLTYELLLKMKQAGFSSLNLSLVSSNIQTRIESKRSGISSDFKEIVMMAHKSGFAITAYFILGLPGHTVSDMVDTLRFLAGLPLLIGASPYYFTPGTTDYNKWNKRDMLKKASENFDPLFSARLTAMDIETDRFSRDEIYTLFRLTRLINYIKKGIDLDYNPDHSYFLPAQEVINEKKWFAIHKNKKVELPISERIISEVFAKPLSICGYKSNNYLRLSEC